ncbi:MAG: hypothetical protein QF368_12190 [SAR202 cluster bacterium]|nr:hypothetical protein [SAR202 cluster bacterium]
MTIDDHSAPAISFSQDFLDVSQVWNVEWRGLIHTGEVIVREQLHPEDFQPLSGETSFRVIFTNKGLKPRERPDDARIALAVPRFRFDAVAETERLASGLSPPPTSNRRDPQMRRVFSTERASQQAALRTRIVESYAQGRLYRQGQSRQSGREFFAAGSIEQCVTDLATLMLSDAFPTPVYNHADFPRTLTDRDVSMLFSGLIQGDRNATDTIKAFGPGLGVVADDGSDFDASHCHVHTVMEQELDSRSGQMQASDLVHALVHGHGLNHTLALFYLLAFMRQARAEVALNVDHRVTISGNQQFEGDRLTGGLVGSITFSKALIDAFDTVTLEPSPTWESALPYLNALESALESDKPTFSGVGEAGQPLRQVVQLREEIQRTRLALEGFKTIFPGSATVAEQALVDLEALSASAGYGSDYLGFYNTAEARFHTAAALTDSLEAFKRARRLGQLVEAITQAKTYLDRMSFGSVNQNLALERDALITRMAPTSLEPNPSLWSAIEVNLRTLRQRYALAYQTHHDQYHRQAAALRNEIERREVRVNALAQLIQVPELGEAVGVQVPSQFEDLALSVRSCSLETDLDLESAPCCHECTLPLDESAPERLAQEVFGAMDASTREYNRRLSVHATRQILADSSSQQMDTLIRLIQVADPSCLENVLDDDVITFLKGFMK